MDSVQGSPPLGPGPSQGHQCFRPATSPRPAQVLIGTLTHLPRQQQSSVLGGRTRPVGWERCVSGEPSGLAEGKPAPLPAPFPPPPCTATFHLPPGPDFLLGGQLCDRGTPLPLTVPTPWKCLVHMVNSTLVSSELLNFHRLWYFCCMLQSSSIHNAN